MEPLKADALKLPSMVMCGDHPSFTKTELNLKELKLVESKEKDKKTMSYARISPTSSRTERPSDASRPSSEHALRPARPAPPRDAAALGNKDLLQVAVGSFRWPPYLVVSWLLVLAAAHALHALTAALAAALPPTRKLCQYFRALTEASWRSEREMPQRARPVALALLTALLHALLGALALAHALLRWAVEPLAAGADDGPAGSLLTKITDYEDFDVSVKNDVK